MEELKERKRYCCSKCTEYYEKYQEAKQLMIELRTAWESWRDEFEEADRKLAELDGRLKKIPLGAKKVTKKKPDVLTLDQIKELAKKFGVALDLEGKGCKKECDFNE